MSKQYRSLSGAGGPAGEAGVRRRPWPFVALGGLLALCAIVVPVAVVLSSRPDARAATAAAARRNSSASGPAAAAGPGALAPLPRWNFTRDKVLGLNLGNWLVLERWMAEDWFVARAGPDAWDEWAFAARLGSGAPAALADHWASWLTEDDVEKAFRAGINTFRVPTGFWMWIPTVAPEPYVDKGQLAHLERLCGYAYARRMYIILDLHGLPGSQNGEQQSGHNTTSPSFFQPAQQARADQTVRAVVDWIAQSPYHSLISAIEVANEPRPYTVEQIATLRAYYERSYATIRTLGDRAPAMMFSDGFVPGDRLAFWYDFAAARRTDPPSLLFTDHPYPGYFPAQNNSADIIKQTCTDAAKYLTFPVPTVITEWSLRTGIQDTAFEKQHYAAQLTAWSWTAGSCFWSIRALDSKIAVLADPVAQYQWSWETLLDRGAIVLPTNKNQTTEQFLSELGTPCGPSKTLSPTPSMPQGTGAAVAVASAAAAKTMVDAMDKAAADAASSVGLAGIGADAYPIQPQGNPKA